MGYTLDIEKIRDQNFYSEFEILYRIIYNNHVNSKLEIELSELKSEIIKTTGVGSLQALNSWEYTKKTNNINIRIYSFKRISEDILKS